MNRGYLQKLLSAIHSIVHIRTRKDLETKYWILTLLCPFLGARSLNDLAQTFGIPKNRLYRSWENKRAAVFQAGIRRTGIQRLAKHLHFLRTTSPATKTRHAVTICTDDSTEETRGSLGGIVGNFYNGALGKVTSGFNVQAIVAVIGDGEKTILLDMRVVLPKSEGPGKPPPNRNEWFRTHLENICKNLASFGASLKGCVVSVDSAYGTQRNLQTIQSLGMKLVTKVHGGKTVLWEMCRGFRIPIRAKDFLGLCVMIRGEYFKPMDGEPKVEYLRIHVTMPKMGDVLLIVVQTERETKFLLSSEREMKAKTIYRSAIRRWQLERVFWCLKQDLGLGDIHNHQREIVMARIMMAFVLYQALHDVAKAEHRTTSQIVREFRKCPHSIIQEIQSAKAFSDILNAESVLHEPEAA